MRRVLMVAYQYPPYGTSSGVLRTLKFSKYSIASQTATFRDAFNGPACCSCFGRQTMCAR
jgi:hypothetical protein